MYCKERQDILESLRIRAEMAYERFNDIPGVYCNKVQGSMYAFPRIDIPEEAWTDAKVSIISSDTNDLVLMIY